MDLSPITYLACGLCCLAVVGMVALALYALAHRATYGDD